MAESKIKKHKLYRVKGPKGSISLVRESDLKIYSGRPDFEVLGPFDPGSGQTIEISKTDVGKSKDETTGEGDQGGNVIADEINDFRTNKELQEYVEKNKIEVDLSVLEKLSDRKAAVIAALNEKSE